jgi:hypothetical protein
MKKQISQVALKESILDKLIKVKIDSNTIMWVRNYAALEKCLTKFPNAQIVCN